jgi:S-adenosylmethionine:tRNA ribosyltransferase-isomerase
MLTVDDFDFALPPALIAQHPAATRTGSRLLHVAGNTIADLRFTDLPALVAPGDLLVFNDTKVIRARLFGQKESGGQVEVLIERIVDAQHAIAQVRASKSPKTGSRIRLAEAFDITVTGREGEFFALELSAEGDLWQLVEAHGALPLPPYITHAAGGEDEARYQTVFARKLGAVAAPTAGLHFDDALLADLAGKGIEQPSTTCTRNASRFRKRPSMPSPPPVRAAAASLPSAPPPCVHSNQQRSRASSLPAPPKRTSSSRRAINSASWTG